MHNHRIWFGMLALVGTLAVAEGPRRGLKGGSVGNSGGELVGIIQRLATTRVKWVFDHEKNAKLLTELERNAVKKLIERGLPFQVVDPGGLDVNRYEDIEGSRAEVQPEVTTASGRKIRARLLSVADEVCDARVVWDIKTRAHVIQWDEHSLNQSTQNGVMLPDSLVRDVAHEVLRYAYHKRQIDRNDDNHLISAKLFVPPADEAVPLPSREYRNDFKRRGKELGEQIRDLIRILKTDMAPHSNAERIWRGYEDDLVILDSMMKGEKIIHELEGPEGLERTMGNLDAFERQMLLQRQTLLTQINSGHRSVEKPKNLGRYQFKDRATYLTELCLRNLEMIQWHSGLRDSDKGKRVKNSIDSVSGNFANFERREWPQDNEKVAQLFDRWEDFLIQNLEIVRKHYPRQD